MRLSSLISTGISLAAVAYLLVRGYRNSKCLRLNHETVVIPDLPKAFSGFRLLHLSDLHFTRRSAQIQRLLSLIDEINPDLICLGGDYAGTFRPWPQVEEFFRKLAARKSVVGIFGNTDHRYGIVSWIKQQAEQWFPFLDNSALCVERQGEQLWVAGVNDPHTGRDNLPAAMMRVPEDAPVILLAHSPEVIRCTLDGRVRLILCGHTHAGQICLPGGIALYHNTSLPAKYASGRHQVGDAVLYVSAGVGSTRVPLRYGCLPEATLFTLIRDGEPL